MPYDTPVQNYYYFLFPHKEKTWVSTRLLVCYLRPTTAHVG